MDATGVLFLWRDSISSVLAILLNGLGALSLPQFTFGRRTWYKSRPFTTLDYAALGLIIVVGVVVTLVTFYDGTRFYNPFK
ncbi:hypothetical protein [Paenibacillus sp. YPG26]|uniref:hypothetical protein n=1 Tax=Paenibacillus sp. YPG26 TaxID=2878915 RepID=UPI00203A5834|nr:hypothetical protein [Paenibacillus sp. YPG26]USB33102.1 hypothetical protein LDO05_17955 [Paenibacillus sp. YPG26]